MIDIQKEQDKFRKAFDALELYRCPECVSLGCAANDDLHTSFAVGLNGVIIVYGSGPNLIIHTGGCFGLRGAMEWIANNKYSQIAIKIRWAGKRYRWCADTARDDLNRHYTNEDGSGDDDLDAILSEWDGDTECSLIDTVDYIDPRCDCDFGNRPNIEIVQAKEAAKSILRKMATIWQPY